MINERLETEEDVEDEEERGGAVDREWEKMAMIEVERRSGVDGQV